MLDLVEKAYPGPLQTPALQFRAMQVAAAVAEALRLDPDHLGPDI